MTGPYIPQVPGFDQQNAPALGALQGLMQHFINPNLDFQKQIRSRIAQDPNVLQQLIDQERQNPGYLKSIGLGGLADVTGGMQATPQSILSNQASSELAKGGNDPLANAPKAVQDFMRRNAGYSDPGDEAQKAANLAQTTTGTKQTEVNTQRLTQDVQDAQRVAANRATADTYMKHYNGNYSQLLSDLNTPGKINGSDAQALFSDEATRAGIQSSSQEKQRVADEAWRKAQQENFVSQRALESRRLGIEEQGIKQRSEDRATSLQMHRENLDASKADNLWSKYGVGTRDSYLYLMNHPEQLGQLDELNKNPAQAQQAIQQNPEIQGVLEARKAMLADGLKKSPQKNTMRDLDTYLKTANGQLEAAKKDKYTDEQTIGGIGPQIGIINKTVQDLKLFGENPPNIQFHIGIPPGEEGTKIPVLGTFGAGKVQIYATRQDGNQIKVIPTDEAMNSLVGVKNQSETGQGQDKAKQKARFDAIHSANPALTQQQILDQMKKEGLY